MLWESNCQTQEYTNKHIFTTIYDQDSFEPVVRIVQPNQANKSQDKPENKPLETLKIYHYHNNHLGTPQELTNEPGEKEQPLK